MSQVPPINPQVSYSMPPAPRKSNAPAIISLICGIVGCVPFLTGLLAVIFGFVGIRKARDPMTGGKGMAIAGLVLGVISIVLWAIFGAGILALLSGTKPMRDAGRAFIVDLANGNVAQAHSRCTSDISQDDCQNLSNLLRAFGTFKDTTVVGVNVANTNSAKTGTVAGAVEMSKANKSFELIMIKQGDDWKVQGVHIGDK